LIHTWGAPPIDDTQLRGLARAVRRGRLGQRQPDALGDGAAQPAASVARNDNGITLTGI